jgi:WD40 repeat protein
VYTCRSQNAEVLQLCPLTMVSPLRVPADLFVGGGQVRLWDIEHRRVVSRLAGHGGWVWCMEPHPTLPATLLTGATDGAPPLTAAWCMPLSDVPLSCVVAVWPLKPGCGCGPVPLLAQQRASIS